MTLNNEILKDKIGLIEKEVLYLTGKKEHDRDKGTAMNNSECTIYIMAKREWIKKHRKSKEDWIQTSLKVQVVF